MFKKRPRKIAIEDISRELVPITGRTSFAIVLRHVLAPEECAALVAQCEGAGFDDALVTGPMGVQVLRQDIRHCGRRIVDDVEMAKLLFARILKAVRGTPHEEKLRHAPWITGNDDGGDEIAAVGLNERLRFLKYGPGHFFAPHQDLRFVRGPEAGKRAGETSHITVQLYLNDRFRGGATRFLSDPSGARHLDVKPKVGSVLIFDHDILHEGSKVTGGIKYSMRSDIMFTPQRAPHPSPTVTPENPEKQNEGGIELYSTAA